VFVCILLPVVTASVVDVDEGEGEDDVGSEIIVSVLTVVVGTDSITMVMTLLFRLKRSGK
jgi:hypothetical protein